DVRCELVRELAPAEALPPRRRVHLVDRHRSLERLLLPALLDPVRVEPLVLRAVDERRRLRRHLCLERDRVGLLAPVEVVLVALPDRGGLDDAFPDPGRVDRCQRIGGGVPVVEVADHADVPRVRRPHREAHTVLDWMCTELRPELLVTAGTREPDVELAERGRARLRHTGTSSSSMRTMPATGIRTQSGRLLSS